MDIIINGVTLQGDFMDADFVGPYEEATKKMQATAMASRNKQYSSAAEGYLEQCATVDTYFDDIFGPGTAAKVFQGSEHNIMVHLKAVEELTDWLRVRRRSSTTSRTSTPSARTHSSSANAPSRSSLQRRISIEPADRRPA